ncbi:hypothetical protein [Reyranella sp.]|uniref:hypothetical protein n=1 Tax=Reyranella sp. TaxID=1929291 RepID=UPI003D124F1E
MTKLVTGRHEVVATSRSWHGVTGGAASNTYSSSRKGCGPPQPGALVLPAPEIEDVAAERGFLFHTTHASDPSPAAVGLKAIEVILRGPLHRTRRRARPAPEGRSGCAAATRRMHRRRTRPRPAAWPRPREGPTQQVPDPELAQRVARECLKLGMMTSVVRGRYGIFRIAPPLTIEPAEIDLGLEIFDRALAKALHRPTLL